VSPGFFKCFLEDEERIAYALGDGLELTMDFMEACDVPLLICFGFEMAGGTDEEAVERLQALGDRLGERCLGAAVENETHCKFDTPARIARLLDMVGRPNVGANWDMANLQAGAAAGYPAGYELVKPHIVNVHAKDVRINDNGTAQWRPIGEGICDWPGQVAALLRDGIVEHITIENHCGPLKEVGLQNLRTLERILDRCGRGEPGG
jgi:sugar phosphate isomerase/epimerase